MPANPGGQLQLKPLIWSMQVPLFKQVILTQSFTSAGERIKDTYIYIIYIYIYIYILDFSKSQNTQLINVNVVLEVDGEGLSVNKSLYRSSREIEICGQVT